MFRDVSTPVGRSDDSERRLFSQFNEPFLEFIFY